MRRLIWGFAGRTYHIVKILLSRLNFVPLFWVVSKRILNLNSEHVFSLCVDVAEHLYI